LLDFALWHSLDKHILTLRQKMQAAKVDPYSSDFLPDETVIKARQAVVARLTTPYGKKNFKDVLQQCDQYGVDHRTVNHATQLMLAAQTGNLPLVEALLARAEADSAYQPARKLWLRIRNGNYLPNPALRLRVLDAHGQQQRQAIYQVLRLDVIQEGNGNLWFGHIYQQMLEKAKMVAADDADHDAS